MLVIIHMQMEYAPESDVGVIDLDTKDPDKLNSSEYIGLRNEIKRVMNSSDPYDFAKYDEWPVDVLEDYPVTGTIVDSVYMVMG